MKRLTLPFHVAAGSDLALVRGQFLEPLHTLGFRGRFSAFLCNGSSHYACVFGEDLQVTPVDLFDFRAHLGERGFARIVEVLTRLFDSEEFRLPDHLEVIGERIIDRGSMINAAPIGRTSGTVSEAAHANRDLFVAHDQATGYRRRLMQRLSSELRELIDEHDLVITLGGQTSFDIVVRGRDKSYAVEVLLAEGYDHLTYIGDALFPGGNDAAILQFIERWPAGSECPVTAIRVANCEETGTRLRELGVLAP